MRGTLGEKIGDGATADIHAWAPGQVVKLFKAGVPRRLGRYEARMTREVFAAGGPAPAVLGEVALKGRFGIVLPRLDGPTLTQNVLTGAVTPEQAGAILATLYISVHETPPPSGVPSLRDWFASRVPGGIPEHIAPGVLALIERLPGDGLCHADLHPNNVIMTADGPRLIDWITAVRAPAAYDLARCQGILREFAPEGFDRKRSRELNAAVQSEYARLAGISQAALTAAMAPCRPILSALALTDWRTTPAWREQLIQSIEASLRSED